MPSSSIKEVVDNIKSDLMDYINAKKEIFTLKATERGAPIAAKSIYGVIIAVLGIISTSIALIAIIFALSLIFVHQGTEAFSVISSLTFGSLCLLAFFILVLVILLGIRKRVIANMQENFIKAYLDKIDDLEQDAEHQKVKADELTALEEINKEETPL